MVSTTHKDGKFGEDPIALQTLDRNSQMLKDLLKGSETKSEKKKQFSRFHGPSDQWDSKNSPIQQI